MTQSEIRAILKKVENMAAFARASGVSPKTKCSLKTLFRLRDEQRTARLSTLKRVESALLRCKPALRQEGRK